MLVWNFQRPYSSAAPYPHPYNWSPPAQSNESTTGYFLERSNSAKKTLERAIEFCQDEERAIELCQDAERAIELCQDEEQETEDVNEECVEEGGDRQENIFISNPPSIDFRAKHYRRRGIRGIDKRWVTFENHRV